ncbi:MAG: hypothetical protein ABL953_04830 [Ilumatobacteraceae bacterium]
MPMRQECKHFESRTYPNGETVRKCDIDLAPDAPWRCPAQCTGFQPRMDAGWTYGSMVASQTPDEPPGLDDGSAAALLDEAEDFLNSIGAQVLAEVQLEKAKRDNHPAGGRKRSKKRKRKN